MMKRFFLNWLFVLLMTAGCTSVPEAHYKEAILPPEDAHPAPVHFERLSMGLQAGAQVGSISAGKCLWPMETSRVVLRRAIDQLDVDQMFEEALEGLGYDITGFSGVVFGEELEEELLRSEYKVGAKITNAQIDACEESPTLLLGSPIGTDGIRGEIYLEVEWRVYDILRRSTVYKTTTAGYTRNGRANPEGLTLLMSGAFEMAAHNLGADPEFYNLIFKGIKPEGWPKREKHEDRPRLYDPQEEVRIENKVLSRRAVSVFGDEVSRTAVLVQAGAGHGSGFFITPQGHILTNNHVVGDAQRVRVVTKGRKQKLIAEVLRTDRVRDVALLKLDEIPKDLKIKTLPIRTDWPAVGDDIYAVGAPQMTKLQDTLTKGIVSAHRKKFRIFGSRQDFIQGDVSIHGGNSGGPLLDAHGNIVGLSVAGYGGGVEKLNASLNLFIPITQALDKLDIELDSAAQNRPTQITP